MRSIQAVQLETLWMNANSFPSHYFISCTTFTSQISTLFSFCLQIRMYPQWRWHLLCCSPLQEKAKTGESRWKLWSQCWWSALFHWNSLTQRLNTLQHSHPINWLDVTCCSWVPQRLLHSRWGTSFCLSIKRGQTMLGHHHSYTLRFPYLFMYFFGPFFPNLFSTDNYVAEHKHYLLWIKKTVLGIFLIDFQN